MLPTALFLLLTLYPWESEVIPALSIRVVNDEDEPISGMPVSEHWYMYTWGKDGYQHSITGADGTVDFGPVRVRVTLLRRLLYPVFHVATAWHRASFGVAASLIAGDAGRSGGVWYAPGYPFPTKLVVRERSYKMEPWGGNSP
jgi:hypothetical protein